MCKSWRSGTACATVVSSIPIWDSELFYFLTLETRLSMAFSYYKETWKAGIEVLNTRFPLPTLLSAGNSLKQDIY